MVNDRKRLEATSELFESEKTYVFDMKLWSSEFRRFFLTCLSISSQRRYTLNNVIFLNIENITSLHESILNEMAKKNEECRIKANKPPEKDIFVRIDLSNELDVYMELDYTDILEKYMTKFEIYKYYIERLPKIEFVFDKEIALNRRFTADLKRFLTDNGYIIMGYKHFIFRPSQKLARYPLLLNAINKNTENEEVLERIKRINDFLMEKTKLYDKILGNVKNAFQLYGMHYTLTFKEHVQKKIALGLFMQNRRLMQISNEVFVRSKYRTEPRPYRVYLTDNMLIVIDVVTRIFGEKLYVVDDPVPMVKYVVVDTFEDNYKSTFFKDHQKFMLKEIDGNDEIFLYFKTEAQCTELKSAISNNMQCLRNKYESQIELCEFGKIGSEIMEIIITDPYYIGSSFSEEEEHRLKQYFLEAMSRKHINPKQNEEPNNSHIEESAIKPLKTPPVSSLSKNISHEEATSADELDRFKKEDALSSSKDNLEVDNKKGKSSSVDGSEEGKYELNDEHLVDITNSEVNLIRNEPEVDSIVSSLQKWKISDDGASTNITNTEDDQDSKIGIGGFEANMRFLRDVEIVRKSREIFTSTCSADGPEDNIIFFKTTQGIFMQRRNSIRCVYRKLVKKLLYLDQYKLIIFIDNDACYWSRLPSTHLESNLICYKADNIWFGNTLGTSYLVVKLLSNTSTSFLHLYSLDGSNFRLMTQLYIGAIITQLIFFSSKLIVCCMDYEVINMYTLNTHELLNMNDMFIELLFTHQYPTCAMEIFKIEKGRYLVCNNKIGFFINQYGSCPPNSSFFVWYNEPTEFKLLNKYIIVLSKENMVIYDTGTGEILKWISKKNLKFVRGCSGAWVHNQTTLFEIKFPIYNSNGKRLG